VVPSRSTTVEAAAPVALPKEEVEPVIALQSLALSRATLTTPFSKADYTFIVPNSIISSI
jgi:hypothetical protein